MAISGYPKLIQEIILFNNEDFIVCFSYLKDAGCLIIQHFFSQL
jgi:hypothetical protein